VSEKILNKPLLIIVGVEGNVYLCKSVEELKKRWIREFLEKVELRGNGNFTHGVSGYELCEILLKELESED